MTFPFRMEGVSPPAHVPAQADLVVIGGGIIGICTALYAARQGQKVVVVEKGRVGAEQSSRNWGWIRVQGRDMAEIPIALESQELWRGLEADCQNALGLRQVGVTYLASNDQEMDRFEDWLHSAKLCGVSSHMLSAAETAAQVGGQGPWIGALHTPTDMKAEPWVATPKLAALAQSEGVHILEHCAARGLETSAGALSAVVTEHGPIATAQAVLAGGAWSALFLRRHGISIPQLSVRSTALATQPLPQCANGAAAAANFAWRRRDDGGYTLAPSGFAELYFGPDTLRHLRRYLPLALTGAFDVKLRRPAPKGYPDAIGTPRHWALHEETPFERMRILDPPPNDKKAAQICAAFGQAFPDAGPVQAQSAWAGMIDVMPDVVPVVDRVDSLPGLTLCTGMCGHGFGAGPGFGRITADLVLGKDPGHALDRFRLSRFSDGSPLVPGPNL